MGLRLSPGVSITSPRLHSGARASPACIKQMVKHGLTRSEINLHFASKSHNHLIVLGIGVEQAPGSSPCSFLGHFAWQDGGRGSDPARMLLRGPVSLVALLDAPLVCQPPGLGEDPGVREQQLPVARLCPAMSRFDLAPALPALCRGSPVGNTSLNTFPHPPRHSPGANPAQ